MIRTSTAIVAAVAALAATGCSATYGSRLADKAGGTRTTTVLQLATVHGADDPINVSLLRWFAARVAALSKGRLEVQLVFNVDSPRADEEQQVVNSVRDGRNQLGWIGSGGWDEVGVRSFQALQAPFLITSAELADVVAEGPIARTMLAGTRRASVTGLALVPGALLHPVTSGRPLRALPDFAGLRLQVERSRVTDAVPVNLPALSVPHDGVLAPFDNPGVGMSSMTGNVVLDPGFNTLFANPAALDGLDRGQLIALREAARALVADAERQTVSEQSAAIDACHQSGIAIITASRADLARLRRAAQPVNAALQRDATTKLLIKEIAEQKAREHTHTPTTLVIPKACRSRSRSAKRAKPRPLSLLNGTYHLLFTRADFLAFGLPASDPHGLPMLPAENTRILDDGKWFQWSEDTPPFTTYTITGDQITIPGSPRPERFTFRRDAHGTLYLTPVRPMDRGDQWVLAGEPWHRVGPPIRTR